MDIPTTYQDSETSWGPDPKDSMPRSPTFYSPLARPTTPPTCTQPKDVFDGVVSTIFVDTIKASVATLLDVVIGEYIREKCIGCEINHPSQRRHPCLYDPPRYYFFNHFEALVNRLCRLSGCGVTEEGCASLVSALRSNPSHLRELDLSINDLKDSGVKLLSDGLGNPHCKLETLRLSGCLVTEEGCASLVSALRSNPSHLRELDLSFNHPGDSGVRLLSAGLEDPHCRLEKLNVEHGGENTMKPGLRKYVCDLTLDPNTVNRLLSLSEENRKVTCRTEKQPYPDHPERFEGCGQVLCREGLTGRCYWEVEWSGRGAVIGVTYKGINRRGWGDDCCLGYNDKSWCLFCSDNSHIARHNNNHTIIDVPSSSSHRVGVYLDWPAGTLSFYRASSDTLTHLYTFTSTFTEPLYPGFSVGDSVSLCQ
ncbi:E3 ubiquitin-protein ligase TRIM39-like [Oncorhynchus masou masou]|uniref:E3 ubiquitin-protein ligase TRIM39-like n=1 Tax=Oncorhynchus masou masou TaxID=90313 RepID=UPI003183083B